MGRSKKSVDEEDGCPGWEDVVPLEGVLPPPSPGLRYGTWFHRRGSDGLYLHTELEGLNRVIYAEYELGLEERYVLFAMHAELALYHLCRAVQTASQITDKVYSLRGLSIFIANQLNTALTALEAVKKELRGELLEKLGGLRYEVEEKIKKEQEKQKKRASRKKKKIKSKRSKKNTKKI